MKKLLIILISIFVATVTFAESEPIKIGAPLGLSGIAAPFGVGELNGLKLAVEEANKAGGINGREIEVIAEDIRSSNLGSVNAVKKLINIEKVDYIIGSTWLDSFGGPLPIVDKAGILTITPSAVPANIKESPKQYPFVFSTWYNHEKEVRSLLKGILDKGLKKISLLFDQDAYFQATGDLIEKLAPEIGLEIAKRIDISVGDTNYTPKLLKLKSAKPDAVIVGFIDEASAVAFLKRRKELIPDLEFYGFHDVDGYVDQEMYAGLLGGMHYVRPIAPRADFVKRYEQAYGEKPILSAPNGYDAGSILIKALKAGKKTAEEISDFMRSQNFTSVTFGETGFDSYGAATGGEFEIVTVKG